MESRVEIQVRGIVQGVGFRPFIYSLAQRRALRGQVYNNSTGVLVDVEGEPAAIQQFVSDIKTNVPPLANIDSIEWRNTATPAYYKDFRIVESIASGEKLVPLSADIATCDDCLKELFDTRNRRYRYPFINCTNCGPRFTIIEGVPYDRVNTTMRDFAMCEECSAEYHDPLDRRFHAEPTACFVCGPRIYLADGTGNEIHTDDALKKTQDLLLSGKIIAIKGIGGFHLACDATNQDAVTKLRSRKYREDKPFALMAASKDLIRNYCLISESEKNLISSNRRPIVLLSKRDDCAIPEEVAPGARTLGCMLPYTPLHYLLFDGLNIPLVMTSGNVSDEPICYEDAEVLSRLNGIADFFLLNNRRIHVRTDDSVVRIQSGREMILRRSRGYAPAPIRMAFSFASEILACGAELKNTFCLARDNYAFVSHHIGNLENLETLQSFEAGINHFKQLFNIEPEIIAHDLHPEYLSTKYALSQDEIATRVAVQHHHAHIASCMADNNIDGEVIGVAMDGLGFGSDGRLWGGEFFVADFSDAERIAHLDYIQLPGGVKAVREPWRIAAVYLERSLGSDFLDAELQFVKSPDCRLWNTIRSMIASGTNSPLTSSMGRLFDAVASIIGLRNTVNYEGQAAIEMEAIADHRILDCYEFDITGENIINAERVIRQIVNDLVNQTPAPIVSTKFHNGIANLILTIAENTRRERRLTRVALSGGVFQNVFLLDRASRLLTNCGFQVFTHSRVPCNDGGISFGQAAIANALIVKGRI